MQSAVMQAKSGSDTVRSSFTTTVRSGGTLSPVTTMKNFVSSSTKNFKTYKIYLENLLEPVSVRELCKCTNYFYYNHFDIFMHIILILTVLFFN